MKRLLLYTFGLTLIFVGILTSAKAVGAIHKSPFVSFMERTYCLPQPCWHDIHIGTTNVEQAKQILSADNQYVIKPAKYSGWDFCWETQQLGNGCLEKSWLSIHPIPDTFRLADAILLFGYPISAENCDPYGGLPSNVADIEFQNHIAVKVYSVQQKTIETFDPSLIVDRIYYSPQYKSSQNDPFTLFGLMGEHLTCGEPPLN